MATAAGPALAAPGMVYVADEGSDTVSVVDTHMRKAVAAIPVGAYANTVSVIDVKSLKVLKNVAVGRSPNGISVAS